MNGHQRGCRCIISRLTQASCASATATELKRQLETLSHFSLTIARGRPIMRTTMNLKICDLWLYRRFDFIIYYFTSSSRRIWADSSSFNIFLVIILTVIASTQRRLWFLANDHRLLLLFEAKTLSSALIARWHARTLACIGTAVWMCECECIKPPPPTHS